MPQFFDHLSHLCCGTGDAKNSPYKKKKKPQQQIKGTVVLMKKNVLDFNDYVAGVQDRIHELLGMGVSVQLVSAVNTDLENMGKGKIGEPAYLEDWVTKFTGLKAGDSVFQVTFDWDESIGLPGAVIIRNNHHSEFYLKSLTLEDVPNHGRIHFVCHSWVYPAKHYKKDRIFFSNKTYLPNQTPEPLRKFREEELETLRGTGEGELEEWDRVYDYDVYNDVGDPDKGENYVRAILGGPEHPYPRRGRTGRAPSKTDPKCESRIALLMSINTYVPRDERFGHVKLGDFLGYSLKALAHNLFPGVDCVLDTTRFEFDSIKEVLSIYKKGITLTEEHGVVSKSADTSVHKELLPHVTHTKNGEPTLKFPMPHVIKDDEFAWETDEEFARETLAGVNPVSIRRLKEFPPKSNLDPLVYGDQNSKITEEDIVHMLDGLTVHEAIEHNKLYTLDYHDALMPYLRRINSLPTKAYATRTLFFLRDDGTLKLLVIELSLPHPDGDVHGAISKVIKPAYEGVEGSIWKLAKAYAGVNDCGIHQLISHWLNTHAAVEPIIIATNRHLSVLHPIHKLLHPHFRDTMNINALARQTLINAGGIFETTVFPGKYALEMSSMVYKDWVFTDHALPTDLVKRGMAVEDSTSPHGYRLLIEDYPYAVDGLEIWSAIEKWVDSYCSVYYKADDDVRDDTELQQWWKEAREVGHGDLKDKPWWPEMKTINDLKSSCTIIIWVSSALHAAVNFGQYPYAGYLPNCPSISRRFLPDEGTPEYEELKSNPESVFLKTITSQIQTLLGISLIEVLSRHSSDEVYLGQRESPEWTSDVEALDAFKKFGEELVEIEQQISERNSCGKWNNRFGPVNMPYTLLIPSSEPGITARGIPNSISI